MWILGLFSVGSLEVTTVQNYSPEWRGSNEPNIWIYCHFHTKTKYVQNNLSFKVNENWCMGLREPSCLANILNVFN